jgi:tetratricopeptide (TPR) repeat protein
MYFSRVVGDPDRTIAAYRTLLELYPDDYIALNNLGVGYTLVGDFERAADAFRRGVEADSSRVLAYGNLAEVEANLGQYLAAESTLARLDGRFPGNQRAVQYRRELAYSRGDYDTAERLARQMRDLAPAPSAAVGAAQTLAQLLILQGRPAEAEQVSQTALTVAADRGFAAEYLRLTVDLVVADVTRAAPEAGRARLEAALRRFPLDDLPVLDRPYLELTYAFTSVGEPARARALLQGWDATGRTAHGDDARWARAAGADIAAAEGRYDDALTDALAFGTRYFCRACLASMLASIHDRAGRTDSALVHWEAYATSPQRMVWWDYPDLARSYQRLGELYEARGDRQKAVEWYSRFTDLWADADPVLQPVVRDVQGRIRRLVEERGR